MAEEDNRDFVTKFYEEVNKTIGGNNENQILTLLLPGIALSKSDFEYNYINNEAKGPNIEANESRLANKLYDYAEIVGGDNGKTLEHQYKSALDMLTPKINPILANAKNQLRELLLKPYPYKFGPRNIRKAEYWDDNDKTTTTKPQENTPEYNDNSTIFTFQEVFFRLYSDYVEQLGEWAKQRQLARDHFQKQSDNKGFTDPVKKNQWVENQYLQWYEDNAEAWLTAVNQKMSVLLSVFSDNDMKIIEGILDSGSGAELQEARQTLRNFRKINPDGGYIYPVKFNPTNWFDYLNTSFTPVDLVNSPTALINELTHLYNQRDYINQRILDVTEQIPSTKDLEELKNNVDLARKEYNQCDRTLQNVVTNSFSNFAKFAVKTICAACCPSERIYQGIDNFKAGHTIENLKDKETNENDRNSTSPLVQAAFDNLKDSQKSSNNNATISEVFATEDGKDKNVKALKEGLSISGTINKGVDILIDGTNRVNLTQHVYLQKITDYTNRIVDLYGKNAEYKNLTNLIRTLNMEKISVENKIKMLESKLSILNKDDINKCFSEDVKPPAVPNGFTQLIIDHTVSKNEQGNSSAASSSVSSSTAGFWIFRKTTHSSSSSSSTQSFCNQEGSQIKIGMNIAKVGIERQWFNPGIFALTEEMYSVAKKSDGDKLPIAEYDYKEIETKDPNVKKTIKVPKGTGVFPCYPTAMVIARDVTIQLTSSSLKNEATASEMSSECSSSRTFFVFNAGDSSSSHSSSAKSLTDTDAYTVTMRFTTPQVIGFYQQIVPEDKCDSYPTDSSNGENSKEKEDSIVKFLQAYEKVIEGKLQKDNDNPNNNDTSKQQ